MRRVLVLSERPTESAVIQRTLAEWFSRQGLSISAPVVGAPGHKGSKANWDKARREILNLLLQEPNAIVATFFDYYKLDTTWPGKTEAVAIAKGNRYEFLTRTIHEAFAKTHSSDCHWAEARFVPHVQMHELEALLFVQPEVTAKVLGAPEHENELQQIRDSCGGCEEIDDSEQTAPSKRIKALFPNYRKGRKLRAQAHQALREVQVDTIRSLCPGFSRWIDAIMEADKVLSQTPR